MINKAIGGVIKKLYKKCTKSHFPRAYASIRYKEVIGKSVNWRNPKTLNEKIYWLEFNSDTTLWSKCADKYAVRDYVKEKGCEELLVPLFGKWDSPYDIDFAQLPPKFVLKTNHGSGDVIIIKDKSNVDADKVRATIQKNLEIPFGIETGEPHYLRIKPCVIAEQLLETGRKEGLVDYKVWCFNGEPAFIFTVSNRNYVTHEANYNMFSTSWENRKDMLVPSVHNSDEIPQPENLSRMLEYARLLSAPFDEVRVDFYEIDGRLYVGELTFTSAAGRMTYFTEEALLQMGAMIKITATNYKMNF